MDNIKLLNDFSNYLKMKGFSFQTIDSYKIDIIMFFKFIIKEKNWEIDINKISIFSLMQIKEKDIIDFLFYLNKKRCNGVCTRNRKLASLKALYKWVEYKVPTYEKNPTKAILYNQKLYRLPKYLSVEQAKKLQTVFTKENCKYPEKNNAIITLLLSSGMRVSEICKINIENINLKDKTILIVGKGNRERTVYFSEYCKQQLLNYLELENKKNNEGNSGALFRNAKKERITPGGIREICKKAYKLIGLEDCGYTVHSLRHTAATIMYQTTNDILVVKEFLGHTTLISTQRYTHISNEEIKRATENNPLSQYPQKKKNKVKRRMGR